MTTMTKIRSDDNLWALFKEDNILHTLFEKIESISTHNDPEYDLLLSKQDSGSKLNFIFI